MESDPLICVKFLKLKLLSNLLTHTLQDNQTDAEVVQYVSKIVETFAKNKYKDALLDESQEFVEEKNRLLKIASGVGYDDSDQKQLWLPDNLKQLL